MFPLFLEREFPPSTLTKLKLGSEVGREGLKFTTAVASLDRHSPFLSPGSRPRGPSRKTAGAVEDGPSSSGAEPSQLCCAGNRPGVCEILG